jgi:hypothetical protein
MNRLLDLAASAAQTSRIEGWDAEAMAFWDQASPTEKAMMLQEHAQRVIKVGNTKSYLLAAADFIARSSGALEPLADAPEDESP